MKLLSRTFSSSKWRHRITLAALFLVLAVSSAQAEAPHVQLRPLAPGWIAIDWAHPDDGAGAITVEREAPAFTWVFNTLSNTFVNMGLEPSRVYRYRVCAVYGQKRDCTPWLAARTLDTPPPFSPPEVPSFTNYSATSNSITVNWTASASYSFYQVRWAKNGDPIEQHRSNGKSFTVNGLRTGNYHFIVQGCNRTLLGSSCSRFSAPIFAATYVPPPPPPPPPPVKGLIYGVNLNDDLLWYRHVGREDGSSKLEFSEGKTVGIGWEFKQVFSGGNGIIYAITPIVEARLKLVNGGRAVFLPASGGKLMWYRHVGRNDGSFNWASDKGKTVGTGWDFKQVFSGGDGIIYAITPIVEAGLKLVAGGRAVFRPASGGALRWYRHDGREDGSFRWAPNSGNKVGTGWDFKHVFSGGDGVIYAIKDNGDLMWYRHDGREDGSFRWAPNSGNKVGTGWNFRHVFSGGDGVIYAVADNGDFLWYRHLGRADGSFRWAGGTKVGTGWFKFTAKQIFASQ